MFNWVHTNFHYNPLKGENGSRSKKAESMTKEAKRKGLLAKQVGEFVDEWRINGRRLTIFFMGFEKSLKPRDYKAEYLNLKEEGKRENEDTIVVDNVVDEEDDELALAPLMATTFQNNFDDNGEFCTEFEKSQVVVAIERHVAQRFRRRVTLADLFMVDAHGNKPKPAPENAAAEDLQKKLPEVETASGSCFVEKPKAAAEAAARNLRRLTGKMTKKKMHGRVHNEPLLGEKKLINDDKLYGKVFDSSSLLPIQAACA